MCVYVCVFVYVYVFVMMGHCELDLSAQVS